MIKKNYSEKTEKIFVLTVALISLIHCLYYVYQTRYSLYMGHDELHYYEMAKRLLETGMYSYWGGQADAYVTPGYPVFLAFIMRIAGLVTDSEYILLDFVRLAQAGLTALTSVLGFALAKKLTGSSIAAGSSAIFVAVSGTLSIYSSRVLSEPLCLFLTFLFLYFFVLALDSEKKLNSFLAGLFFALTILTRPPIACMIPFFVIILIVKKDKSKLVLFACGFLIALIPWWIRNLIVLGKFVAFSTQSNAFYYGFTDNPESYNLEAADSIAGNIKYAGLFFKEDFFGTLRYMTVTKFNRIFLVTDESVKERMLAPAVDLLVRQAFVALGFVGMIISLIKKKHVLTICMFLFYMLATFLVIPTVRYGFQFYPIIGMFAGLLIESVLTSFKTKRNCI